MIAAQSALPPSKSVDDQLLAERVVVVEVLRVDAGHGPMTAGEPCEPFFEVLWELPSYGDEGRDEPRGVRGVLDGSPPAVPRILVGIVRNARAGDRGDRGTHAIVEGSHVGEPIGLRGGVDSLEPRRVLPDERFDAFVFGPRPIVEARDADDARVPRRRRPERREPREFRQPRLDGIDGLRELR